MALPYTWIKRATANQKREMDACVEALNEHAYDPESDPPECATWRYERRRTADAWIVVLLQDDKVIDSGSFVQCSKCGGVRDLWEGQIEFCLDCWAEW